MAEFALPKDFFEKNPLEPYTTPQFFLAAMLGIFGSDKLTNLIKEKFAALTPERVRQSEVQLRLIEETNDPAALVDLMRKGIDILNSSAFAEKVLANQDECMPLLLKRYMTSGQDKYIEISAKVLAKADEIYVRQLQEMYDRIRNPYARAFACLIFGLRGMKDRLQFLAGEYENFKRNYSGETLDQFPLIALYLLSGKAVI